MLVSYSFRNFLEKHDSTKIHTAQASLRVSCACTVQGVGRLQESPSVRYGDALHSDLSVRRRNIELVYFVRDSLRLYHLSISVKFQYLKQS